MSFISRLQRLWALIAATFLMQSQTYLVAVVNQRSFLLASPKQSFLHCSSYLFSILRVMMVIAASLASHFFSTGFFFCFCSVLEKQKDNIVEVVIDLYLSVANSS